MKHHTNKQIFPPVAPMSTLCEAQVAVILEQHCFLLNDGRLARQAVSCLITPEVGDRVVGINSHDDCVYILHILQRQSVDCAVLSAPGMTRLMLRQNQISLTATEQLQLQSLRDVELGSAIGALRIHAPTLLMTVTESMVQNVNNFIGKAGHYLLEVKLLLRLHSHQSLITAEKDIKVDGERISMG